jgi:hypothetical protein
MDLNHFNVAEQQNEELLSENTPKRRGPGKKPKKSKPIKQPRALKQDMLKDAYRISADIPMGSPFKYRHWDCIPRSSNHTVSELKKFFENLKKFNHDAFP